MPIHRPLGQEPLDHLVQRDILALLNHPDDEVGMAVEPRAAPPPSRHATANPHPMPSPSNTSIEVTVESAARTRVTSQSIHRTSDVL
jgi:hypothetical protein